MSEAVADTHGAAGEHEEHAHASTKFYIGIAVFLAIITGLEIWMVQGKTVNHPGNEDLVRFWLTVCSIAKFVGVVAFFMHLYFDRKLLTFLFCAGLVMAACTMVALLHLLPKPLFDPPDERQPSGVIPVSDSASPAASDSASPAAADSTSPSPADSSSASPDSTSPSPGASQSNGDVNRGQKLVVQYGCVACHNMPGNPPPASPIGPDQHGLATRAATRIPGKDAETYIRESIATPGAYVVPGYKDVMPPLRKKMSDQDFNDIVAYLMVQK